MKNNRQNLILKLIAENSIETQKDLTEKLSDAGVSATQATVSRDIKELNLIKVHDHDEHYKYAVAQQEPQSIFSTRLYKIFRESVVSINSANNLVIIKTLTGNAGGAAAAVDAMNHPAILGTIAGDDTIFVALRSNDKAKEFCADIRQMMK